MTRLVWLADEFRAAGLEVVEVGGWQTRGSTEWAPVGVTVHHTASPAATSAAADAAVITHGHARLAGPIAQVMVDRSARVWVIAAGRANHAGVSSVPWAPASGGNRTTVGIEACNNGVGELWPAAQIDTLTKVCAVLIRRLGVDASRIVGHKEICVPGGRKIDPAGPWAGGGTWADMDVFRARVAAAITGPVLPAANIPDPEETHMAMTDVPVQCDAYGEGWTVLPSVPFMQARAAVPVVAPPASAGYQTPVARLFIAPGGATGVQVTGWVSNGAVTVRVAHA